MRNFIIDRIKTYFEADNQMNRVILLTGPSGVAKSALIKQAAEDSNMRIVDIRTAFMSRLDIEGLSEKVVINGKMYSEASPMMNLIKCTDEYLRVARESCKIIEEEIKNSDKAHADVLKKSLEKLEYESKTPVLFFDEITRGEPSVRQVLTKILTDKEFMGYPMKEARVIAATNSQRDTNGDYVEIYSTNDIQDSAFYDRFESIYVDPKTMNPIWKTWAKQNLEPSVYQEMESFTPYKTDHFTNTPDIREALITPYPCYRTWELYSNYVKRGGTSSDYKYHLVGVGSKGLELDEFLEESIKTNTPCLLVSPSGIGKTARVKQYCKDHNYELISINLSEVDRLDLEGMPVKQETLKAMFEGVMINKNIAEKVKNVFEASTLPTNVTVRAPKKSYVDTFKKALETKNKVVIYFDECNRVQNVSVMSAIFQVISDNRLFGVDFNPENVTTVLSCNMGDNNQDAQDLDPALCARFAIWSRDRYMTQEVRAFTKYSMKFHRIVKDFINNMPYTDLNKMLSSVETRNLEESSASTRALEDLSGVLESIDKSSDLLLKGSIIFSDSSIAAYASEYVRYDATKNKNKIFEAIKSNISRWAVLGLDDEDLFPYSRQEVIEYVGKVQNGVFTNEKEIVQFAIALDTVADAYRRNYFSMILGRTYGEKFTDVYNTYTNEVKFEYISTDSPSIDETTKRAASTMDPKKVSDLINTIPSLAGDISKMARVAWRAIGTYPRDFRLEIYSNLSKETIDLYRDKNFINTVQNSLK